MINLLDLVKIMKLNSEEKEKLINAEVGEKLIFNRMDISGGFAEITILKNNSDLY